MSARDILRQDKGLNGGLDRLPLLTWIMFLKFLDDLELQRAAAAMLAGQQRSDTSPETLTPSPSPIRWARVASDSPRSRRSGRAAGSPHPAFGHLLPIRCGEGNRWRDWAANPPGVTGGEPLACINQPECTRPNGRVARAVFA